MDSLPLQKIPLHFPLELTWIILVTLSYCLRNALQIAAVCLILPGTLLAQGVVINEVMSSNGELPVDEDGDTSDWLELYNTADTAVSLAGFFISDTESDYFRFALPDTILPPGGFLLVFASGKNRATAGAEIHTNFAVSADGEALLLSRQGTVVHRLDVPALGRDLSYGLSPDGGPGRQLFSTPTPGAANSTEAEPEIYFSIRGGIYYRTQQLSLSSSLPFTNIRYTTDGTTPTGDSPLYTGQLSINASLTSQAAIYRVKVAPDKFFGKVDNSAVPKSVVIRAAAFDATGRRVSDSFTHTYVIKPLGSDHGDLPVVCIAADHESLFDHETGIFVPGVHWDPSDEETGNYFQTGDAWEREISFEYFEPGGIALNQKAGLRIHGGWTRQYVQKGLRLYARSEYGSSTFSHQFFEQKPIHEFKRLVLRPFSSSYTNAGVEDYLSGKVASTLNLDVLAARPVVVYLNGEYWGIYYLQERLDTRYVEANYGVNSDSVDIVEGWGGAALEGNPYTFRALYEFIENNDLSATEAYEAVVSQVDIDNFIDYELFEIFIANKDWPANNVRCWRQHKDGARWRWIFIDGDDALNDETFKGFAHALSVSSPTWQTNAFSTLILRKLLENDTFKTQFAGRLRYLLANELSPASLEAHAQTAIGLIGHEVETQIARFSFRFDEEGWTRDISNILDFLARRPCVVADQYRDRFGQAIPLNYACERPSGSISGVNLYPNPNNGSFTLEFDMAGPGVGTATIIDAGGQVRSSHLIVSYNGLNRLTVDTGLKTGFYILRIVTDQTAAAARFIVE